MAARAVNVRKRHMNLAISRRGFLKATSAAAFYGKTIGREKLRAFSYTDVKLTGGPLKDQFDRIYRYYSSLDNDRLLKVYRQKAGLAAPGEDMGGWYDADGFVPGHALGQYISGLARYGATRKVRQLVTGYAATLGANDNPFASEKASTTWPCYILDKYEIGLIDAYRLAGVTEARDLLRRVIRGAQAYIPDHTYDRGPASPKQAPYDEPYILPENLFAAYEVTRDRAYREMARKYLLDGLYFDPLAQNRNLLPGKHAYSHAIALSSAAKAYLALGDPKYLAAIRNAWNMLEQTQQYASGGWGPKEAFVEPHEGKLAKSLTATHNHFETPCGYYAQAKLARYLLCITGESRYGDGLERVLYNTLLGATDPDGNGDFFYYSDYHPRAVKTFYHSKWPCCSGTLVQGVADYPINIYFHNANGIYVNLYTPSEVRWTKNGAPVRLLQSTRYPHDGAVEFRIATARPLKFTVYLRIPAWAASSPGILVNGKSWTGDTSRNSFAAIRRKWRDNDTIQLEIPLTVRGEPIDDRNKNIVAAMKGPLMMVMLNPRDESFPEIALTQGLDARFKPFYEVNGESYSTYFRLRAQ